MNHSGDVTEAINRNVVVSLLLKSGYNVFLPVYNDGIDLILHRATDNSVVKVQLKSRLTIDRKSEGRDISVVFPEKGDWFMISHDRLPEFVPQSWRASRSWTEAGTYTASPLSAEMCARLAPFKLGTIEAIAEEAVDVSSDVNGKGLADVFEELRVFRRSRSFPPLTVADILDLRDEGRRY